ncbi:uncharacterized protein DS421_3g83840 [Arachis hypogaea]|nr:uncharacterized protein DS421_3g83840 [Arachis hypogaea]
MTLTLNSKNKFDGSIKKPNETKITSRRNYYHGDRFRVAELKEELYAVRQSDLSVTAYFMKLKPLWEELDSFQPISLCNCGEKCSCGLGVVRRYRAEGNFVRFLRGLSEQFIGVKVLDHTNEPSLRH